MKISLYCPFIKKPVLFPEPFSTQQHSSSDYSGSDDSKVPPLNTDSSGIFFVFFIHINIKFIDVPLVLSNNFWFNPIKLNPFYNPLFLLPIVLTQWKLFEIFLVFHISLIKFLFQKLNGPFNSYTIKSVLSVHAQNDFLNF